MPRAAPRVKALVAASRKSGEAASARGLAQGRRRGNPATEGTVPHPLFLIILLLLEVQCPTLSNTTTETAMLDGDDIGDVALTSNPTTWFGVVVLLVALGILFAIVSRNEKDCSQMKCVAGSSPRLMDNECLCVSKATPVGLPR